MDSLIVTLAGRSSRMGSPKQHLEIRGHTFLEHILTGVAAQPLPFHRVVFVGGVDDGKSRAQVENVGGLWVINHEVDLGPLHSIRLALDGIPAASAFLLWPIDHPLITPETVARIRKAGAENPDCIIIPCHGGRRGHPPCFPAWARREIFAAPLEAGARWVLQQHPDRLLHLDLEDPGITTNLNTPEKLSNAAGKP